MSIIKFPPTNLYWPAHLSWPDKPMKQSEWVEIPIHATKDKKKKKKK